MTRDENSKLLCQDCQATILQELHGKRLDARKLIQGDVALGLSHLVDEGGLGHGAGGYSQAPRDLPFRPVPD